MPRLRFERAPVEKREPLLDAATHEFAAHGYEDASINRILLAGGFSKGSFYYYFDDKADLAVAVLERWAKCASSVWCDAPLPNTPEEFWKVGQSLIDQTMERLRHMPHVTLDAMMRLGTALARFPEVRERLASEPVTGMMTKITNVWKRGQEIGAVRTDLPLPTLLALLQDTKLTLVRLLLPSDRAATVDEIDAFTRTHWDLVRRIAEAR